MCSSEISLGVGGGCFLFFCGGFRSVSCFANTWLTATHSDSLFGLHLVSIWQPKITSRTNFSRLWIQLQFTGLQSQKKDEPHKSVPRAVFFFSLSLIAPQWNAALFLLVSNLLCWCQYSKSRKSTLPRIEQNIMKRWTNYASNPAFY